jgi:hypothetical protein
MGPLQSSESLGRRARGMEVGHRGDHRGIAPVVRRPLGHSTGPVVWASSWDDCRSGQWGLGGSPKSCADVGEVVKFSVGILMVVCIDGFLVELTQLPCAFVANTTDKSTILQGLINNWQC